MAGRHSIFRPGDVSAIADRIIDADDREDAMGYVRRNITLAATWTGALSDDRGDVRWECDIPRSRLCVAMPECLWHRLSDGDRRQWTELIDLVDHFHPDVG